MAATYLHNTIHFRPPTGTRDVVEHSRNLSAISCTTLYTNTTLHSQTTTEPLLLTVTSSEAARPFYEPESRDDYDFSPHLRWNDERTIGPDANTFDDEKGPSSRRLKRKPRRWRKAAQLLFEVVICLWSAYNAVRYFIAFTIYRQDLSTGRNFSLALGTSAGASFVFGFLCFLLSAIRSHLVNNSANHGIHLIYVYTMMQYLSSVLLLAPAAVNFALLFIWKNTPNTHYSVKHRCHIDIDALWSPTFNPCTDASPSWVVWLILSSVRLALTLSILLAYHLFSAFYPYFSRRPAHVRLSSRPTSLAPNQTSPENHRPSSGMMLPHSAQNFHTQNSTSAPSSDDVTLKGDFSPPTSRIHLARSQSSGLSGETSSGDFHVTSVLSRSSLTEESDRDQGGHVDRFRSLLNQITQEAEEALRYAQIDRLPSSENNRASSTPDMTPPSYSQGDEGDDESYDENIYDELHGDYDNVFNLPPIPPALGYNEFGLPYPPEQDIRVLNGYIRRMPTIESMGSGEIGSSIGASSNRAGSMYTSSRPPTRNTLLSFYTGDIESGESSPPSRANSLSARAEILAAMASRNVVASEHGELFVRPETALGRHSTPSSFAESPIEGPPGDPYSSNGSRGTSISYQTATMGSVHDPNSAVDAPRTALCSKENQS